MLACRTSLLKALGEEKRELAVDKGAEKRLDIGEKEL